MENFYLIYCCYKTKFKVFLNGSNSELLKKFNEINRKDKSINKFVLVIESIKCGFANKSQFNWEDRCDLGEIYAIKVDQHRFYTLVCKNQGYKEFYISRYGKKQSQTNDKKLQTTIDSIKQISIQKLLE